MDFVKSWRFRLPVLAVLGSIVATLSISTAVGFPGGSGPSDSVVDSLLLAGSRDHLAVCVDIREAASIDEGSSRSAVDSALSAVSADPFWVTAGLSAGEPTVQVGCPGVPRLLNPGVSYPGKPVGDLTDQRVDRASSFRVFVFVLPQSEIDKIFGDSLSRTDPQEFLCSGEECIEVSTALYVGDQEIADASVMKEQLRKAIGLGTVKE